MTVTCALIIIHGIFIQQMSLVSLIICRWVDGGAVTDDRLILLFFFLPRQSYHITRNQHRSVESNFKGCCDACSWLCKFACVWQRTGLHEFRGRNLFARPRIGGDIVSVRFKHLRLLIGVEELARTGHICSRQLSSTDVRKHHAVGKINQILNSYRWWSCEH